jgi:hypothetical protein
MEKLAPEKIVSAHLSQHDWMNSTKISAAHFLAF